MCIAAPPCPYARANDAGPDSRQKHAQLASRICISVSAASIVFPSLLLVSLLRAPLLLPRGPTHTAPRALTIVTLSYNQPEAHRNIAHNCAVISRTRHRFIVHTDEPWRGYCGVCECRRFAKAGCACPAGPGGCGRRNPCEKLAFLVRAVREHREVVLLDSDLVVVKAEFLERLGARAMAHDFLASYGHAGGAGTGYHRDFNSGLVFMRWLPHVDYDEMMGMMYRAKAQYDQAVVSAFVHRRYDNWDVLSLKWHCRMLRRMKQDIPPRDCYTLHGRQETDMLLRKMNRTRLRIA